MDSFFICAGPGRHRVGSFLPGDYAGARDQKEVMTRHNVAIVTDSTAFLPPALCEDSIVDIFPLRVRWGDENPQEALDIAPTHFYRRMAQRAIRPTALEPSVDEFVSFFSNVAQTAASIVGIFTSGELSHAVARAAAELISEVPIVVIDSDSVSAGMALIVAAAIRTARQGLDYQVVAATTHALIPRTRQFFVVDTLEFLHRHGDIDRLQRLVGSLLAARPLLQLVEGRFEPVATVHRHHKAMGRLLKAVITEAAGAGVVHAAIVDAAAPHETRRIYQALETYLSPETLFWTQLSPLIGMHLGPGAVGVAFYTE